MSCGADNFGNNDVNVTCGAYNCQNLRTTEMCEADTYDPKEKKREDCGADENFGADNCGNMDNGTS